MKAKLTPKGFIQSRTDFGTDGYGGPAGRTNAAAAAKRSRGVATRTAANGPDG